MWGVILVKISIALFLMRLVPPGRNWKVFLWATIGMLHALRHMIERERGREPGMLTRNAVFLVCFMLACTGTLVFQCWPIRAVWTFQYEYCFSNATFAAIGLTNTSINCATDFLLATLPVPVIVRLHVNKRTKMTLALILSVGYFACAAGIVKAVKQATFFAETDPLWHNSFNVWNMIELCVGITAASLPGLRPLFAKILASTKSVFSHSWGSNDRTVANNSSSSGSHHRHNHNDQRRGNFKFRAGISLLDMSNISGGGGGGGETSKSKSPPRPQRPSRSNRMDDDDDEENGLFQVDPKRYTVAVTAAARDPGDDGNWGGDDLESPARSDSQERLTRPTPAHTCIYKTTEVSQTSLLRR